MPEMLEVEVYRTVAAATVGLPIAEVHAPDRWFLKGPIEPAQLTDALVGRTIGDTRRHGKLLLLDTDGDGPVLGLRFGMTGVLEFDGHDALGPLQYGSARRSPEWDRFALRFADGRRLVLRDPRRLGGVELDPDEGRLGPDAGSIGTRELAAVLAGSASPLKARLMDQARLAGLGNLLTDEILWRAGLDPARPARSLSADEVGELHRVMRRTLRQLARRGGSHCGDLQDHRQRGGCCPRDGAELLRRTVGGRTTYSCPDHQR